MATRIIGSRYSRVHKTIIIKANIIGQIRIEFRIKLQKFDLIFYPNMSSGHFGPVRYVDQIKYRSDDLFELYCMIYRAFKLIDNDFPERGAFHFVTTAALANKAITEIMAKPETHAH